MRVRNLRIRAGCLIAVRCRFRGGSRKAVDVHPQEALFADFPFDINDFQPFRAGNSLGGFANFFQLQAETPRPKAVRRPLTSPTGPTKKWACAHPSCDPLQSEMRVYAPDNTKARHPKRG